MHTHGHTNRDDFWVRFEGENLEYFKDINVMRPKKEDRSPIPELLRGTKYDFK